MAQSWGAAQRERSGAEKTAEGLKFDIKSGEIHARRIRAEMSRRQTRFQAMQQRLPDAAWELEHGGRKRHSAAEEGGMTSQSAIVDGEAAPTDAAPSERGDSSTKPSPAAGEDVGRLGLLAPDKEDRRIDDERLAFEEEEWRSGGGGPRGSDAQVTPSVSGFVGPSPFDRLLPGEIRRVAKVQRALCGRCHGFLCDGDVRDALPPPWCQVRVDALGLIQAVGPVGTAGAEVGEGGGDGHISLAEARASAEGGGEEDCVPFRAAIPGQQTCLFMDEATHELRREPPAGTSAAGYAAWSSTGAVQVLCQCPHGKLRRVREWQRTIIEEEAERLSPREAAERESAIRDAVGAIDADGNGILSEDEVSSFLADPSGAVLEDGTTGQSIETTLFALLRGVGANESRSISVDELVLMGVQRWRYHRVMERVFQRIDIDQNGTIEEEELMAAISGSAGLTRADVKFLVDSVDINRDGKIDLMEFHAMMRNATL